jgi:sec-independent protein translocase protein TatA
MFKSFGWPEALVILVIVLVIFGAGKLPQIGGAIGKSIREFRKAKAGEDEEEAGKPKVAAGTTKETGESSTKANQS